MNVPIRKSKVNAAVQDFLTKLESLNRFEILSVLAQILIHSGYQIYYQLETKDAHPKKLTAQQANDLYYNIPTLGTTLMKVGFDFQGPVMKESLEAVQMARAKEE